MTVKLTGTIIIPVNRQDTLLPLLKDHIAASRSEPGNLRFNVIRDDQSPDLYHLDEEFVDEAAFAYHQERGAASPWGEQSKDLVRDFHKTSD